MNVPDYQSKLQHYLELRGTLGVRTDAFKSRLQSFVTYISRHAGGTPIRAEMAVDWAIGGSAAGGKLADVAGRLSIVRVFLRYLKAYFPETEIPDRNLVSKFRRPSPYIFSNKEINDLLISASLLGPNGSLRPHTHRTLLGLLACTGLRVGEALNLRISDVLLDVVPPCLRILNSKFDKSRWVVLHPTAAAQLRCYVEQRRELNYDATLSDVFFVSEQGRKLDGRILRRTFRRLLHRCGIGSLQGKRGPTLHSFRHTFAVERLKRWYQSGIDTRELLPHLSVYLGHVDPASSYWYLTATPELMGAAAQLFELYAHCGETS